MAVAADDVAYFRTEKGKDAVTFRWHCCRLDRVGTNGVVGGHHPNLWELIGHTREEQASTKVTIQHKSTHCMGSCKDDAVALS